MVTEPEIDQPIIDDGAGAGTIRVRPDRFVAGGEVLARDADGRIVFVRGALPGEDVTVVLTEQKKDWARGFVGEIHEAASERVEPPCVHRRDGCGGCDWQHVAVANQLSAKISIVSEALRRTARLQDPKVERGASVSALGYRTTIRVVGDATGRASFRSERSHDTIAPDACMVAHPTLSALLPNLVIPAAVELTMRVSVATGEITALWDFSAGDVGGLPTNVTTGGRAKIHEDVAGFRFRVSAASFFQSGPEAAELLVSAVRRAAPELETASTVLDAFSGVGLFALAATQPSARLIAVESSRSSVDDCRVNLAGRDARVESKNVDDWKARKGDRIDVIVADPARTGLDKAGAQALAAAEAPVFVLVSCDPVALARDATLLAKLGYQHESSEVIDLFPHTHHVEVVSRFVKT